MTEGTRKEVNVKCRRDSYQDGRLSSNSGRKTTCTSSRAYVEGTQPTRYKCVECQFVWTVATGGGFAY